MLDRTSTNEVSVYAEGSLYKTLCIRRETFSLYYGYYEQCDRDNPLVNPMPLYPDFRQHPRYASCGSPFVTKMQDACEHFRAARGRCAKENECAECTHYIHGEDLIGLCREPRNRYNSYKDI